ncbi:hypothetical protein ACFOY4_01645 [Actinomadura syzygii]|uniref:hypothetical protein n=1 Tax=Actinomadura syzygii TaxID=1427538 RepID=UPI0016525239|nr:hypothetical protein [Actinomadura syzygii]
MPDRTRVQMQILDRSREQAQAAIDTVEQIGLHLEHVEDGQPASGIRVGRGREAR